MSDGSSDTFAALLQLRPCGAAPGDTRKRPGIRVTWSWSRVSAEVRSLAAWRNSIPPRRQPCHHRRQPSAPLLGHDRGAMPGRGSGAHVPGCRGAGTGVCAAGRRHQVRHCRRSGTGGQADRVPRAIPRARTNSVRRSAWVAALQAALPAQPGCSAGVGAQPHAQAAGFHRARDRARQIRRRGDHALHLRHDRKAEGRLHHPCGADQRGSRRLRLRPARRERRDSVLPADGLGGGQPVFLRPVAVCRLHRQLPGVGRDGHDRHARDRADLLFRAAAGVREPAHPGDDPHRGRGRDQARDVPLLHVRGAPLRRRDPRWQDGRAAERVLYALGRLFVYGRCAMYWA